MLPVLPKFSKKNVLKSCHPRDQSPKTADDEVSASILFFKVKEWENVYLFKKKNDEKVNSFHPYSVFSNGF